MTTTTKVDRIRLMIPIGIQLNYEVSLTPAQAKKLAAEYRDPDESWEDQMNDCIQSFVEMELADELQDQIATSLPSIVKVDPLPSFLQLKNTDDIEVEIEYVEVDG